jgi:hypothetical protein
MASAEAFRTRSSCAGCNSLWCLYGDLQATWTLLEDLVRNFAKRTSQRRTSEADQGSFVDPEG